MLSTDEWRHKIRRRELRQIDCGGQENYAADGVTDRPNGR
jgi:hypothetical protein